MKKYQEQENESTLDHVEFEEEEEDDENPKENFFRCLDETLINHSIFWREIQKNKKRMEVIEESFVDMEESLEVLNYIVEDLQDIQEFGPIEKQLYNDFYAKIYSSDEELAELYSE